MKDSSINPTIEFKVLLLRHGLSIYKIANKAGVSQTVAGRAFHHKKSHRVSHGAVLLLRVTALDMLQAAGWSGNPDDLWVPFDSFCLDTVAA